MGGNERTPDPRDYPIGAFTPATFPPSYSTDISAMTVEMQEHIPDCGANVGAYVKDQEDSFRGSVEYLWKKIKITDGYPPEDGTDMLSIFGTLKNVGICSNDLLPTNSALDLASFTDPSMITPAMDADAANHKIATYATQFNPSMDDIRAAIYAHECVVILMQIGSEFWTPSWNAADILPLRPPQSPVGGHFVLGYGYDQSNIYFLNEWSSAWGNKGTGYFGSNYISFVKEIGAAVDTSGGTLQRDLSFGMVNQDVWTLQRFLVKGGYGTFTPTGFFGQKTLAAVVAYQKAKGIQPAAGYVGPITRGWINKELSV